MSWDTKKENKNTTILGQLGVIPVINWEKYIKMIWEMFKDERQIL